MGKLDAFSIKLENQDVIYHPGQDVVGQVHVELNAEMNMEEIRLQFHGYAKVEWREDKLTYRNKEEYFNFTDTVYGKSLGQPEKLGAGHHTFPFHYTLPSDLPSSFEHFYGKVRYWLKATIHKPWKFDHNTKHMITVVSLLDLNKLANAPQPIQNQAAKNLCCLCCESGPITGHLRLEKLGHVPGEAIYLQGEVQNLSNTACSVEVRLIMLMFFNSDFYKTKRDRKEVTRVILDPSEPGNTYSLSGKRIVVPPVAPSYMEGCNIIEIRYQLELHINPSNISKRLIVPVEVIIGSIPLQSALQNTRNQSEPITTQNININFIGEPLPIPTAPDMPPPKYAECVFGKIKTLDADDNEYTMGQKEYAPAYPYYDLS